MLITYSANNSGGDWWLEDKDWLALEAAGWYVEWGGKYFCHAKDSWNKPPDGAPEPCPTKDVCKGHRKFDGPGEKWLGALATYASKEFDSLANALREFESITGQDVADEGCNCCGPPHSFNWTDPKLGYQFVSGKECIRVLYKRVPASLRAAAEAMNQEEE